MNEFEVEFGVTHRHTIYDSEEEEDEVTSIEADLRFDLTNMPSTAKCAPLVVTVGHVPAAFVKVYLQLESTPVLSVFTGEPEVVLKGHNFTRGATKAVSSVYRAANTLVCVHEKDLKAEHCNRWCEGILKAVEPREVLVLCSLPLNGHISSPLSVTSFMRELQTSFGKRHSVAPYLEPPNTIKGEPAAVLTFCELNKVPGTAIVQYCSSNESGVESVNHFCPLLSSTFLCSAAKTTRMSEASASQLIKAVLPKPREDLGNLYI